VTEHKRFARLSLILPWQHHQSQVYVFFSGLTNVHTHHPRSTLSGSGEHVAGDAIVDENLLAMPQVHGFGKFQ
jgi:hypothetical protein